MDDSSIKRFKSHNVSYSFPESKSDSRETLNSYKKLLISDKRSSYRDDHTGLNDTRKRAEAPDKAHSLYLGTKIQPAWETRTLKINPVTSDDLSRFLGNEHHTQRWSIISQIMFILLYNLRRLPFLWSIFIFLCEVIAPFILPSGVPRRAWYSSAIPLFVSLFMSIFVNVLEFTKRYNLGRFLDNKKCVLLKDGKLSSVRSGDVAVGNILKLSCDEQVPADCVVLYTSNPDGALYLDACYLDGQTDLKTKYSINDFKIESSIRSYNNLKGNIICDKPCPDMNKFSGLLKIKGYPRPCNITVDNFIMKGSILRNTSYVYAVVVYTGPDTKASQNFLRILKPIKIGCLEQTINGISIFLGLIYVVCLTTSIIVRYVTVLRGVGKFSKNVQSPVNSLLFIIFRFTVLYSPIIPTTLPAIMDLLRLLYSPFYNTYSDSIIKNLNKKEPNEVTGGTWTLNSGLCEELGLVDFIFTDKTGTLTTNNLSITLVTILSKSFTPKQLVQSYQPASSSNISTNGHTPEKVNGKSNREHSEESEHFMRLLCICNPCLNMDSEDGYNSYSSGYKSNYSRAYSFKLSHFKTKSFDRFHFNDSGENFDENPHSVNLDDHFDENSQGVDNSVENEEEDEVENLPMYKKTKSKAHFGTVSYINDENVSKELFDLSNRESLKEERRYLTCISKEDECMVNLANDCGYFVSNRTRDRISVNCNGKHVNYEILGVNEFTSSRKRMSVLVTNIQNNENFLYIKGEAYSMLSIINDQNTKLAIESRLKKNSIFGYRVIICGYRSMTSTEVLEYESSVLMHRDGLDELCSRFEKDVNYLGIIMFRDEIQRNIVKTIDLLMDSGIRIWVLTGDNKEATIQTCYLTKLLVVPTNIFIIQIKDLLADSITPKRISDSLGSDTDTVTDKIDMLVDNIYNKYILERNNSNEQLCLIIESDDLEIIMQGNKGQQIFMNMACSSDVVIGCLLTPIQKGQLVQMVKTKLIPTPITLSIGDGINDVQMLQQSHLSICILNTASDASNNKKNNIQFGGPSNSFNANNTRTGKLNVKLNVPLNGPLNGVVNGVPDKDNTPDSADKNDTAESSETTANRHQDKGLGLEKSVYSDSLDTNEKLVINNDIIGYCDFCVDSFSNIRELLFKQGTRMLKSTSLIIYFTIYKGLVFILPIFYYQIFTNWVGLDLYGSLITILYHLVFTFIPLIMFILFYQDISYEIYNHISILYTISRRRIYLNINNSLYWMLEGILGSFVNYLPLHLLVINNDNIYKSEVISNRTFGLLISVSSIIIFNTKLLINYTPNTGNFTFISLLYYFASPPLYIGLVLVSSRRSLRLSSQQILRIIPFYILIPIWITFTVILNILSNLLQLYILPNLIKHIKLYIINNNNTINFKNIKNIFNFKNINIKNLMPVSRPFKVKNIHGVTSKFECGVTENNINKLINIYTLRFKDIQLESDYRLDKNKKHYYENGHWYKIIFILLFLYYLSSFVVEYLIQKRWFKAPVIYCVIPTVLLEIVLVICIIISFNHRLFIRFINHILYSLVTFMIVQHVSNRFLLRSISWLHTVLFPIFTFVILRIPFIISVGLNLIFLINTLISINSTNIHILPLFFGINIFVGFVGYDLEYKSRSNFIMEFSVLNYRQKQSELLNTMLPKIVVSKMINAKLNENGIPIGFEAERHENVTVIFADVYNFQELIATIEPHRLVEILDTLFLSFDRCSKEFNAIKIETVSETYLTSMGLNTSSTSQTKSLGMTDGHDHDQSRNKKSGSSLGRRSRRSKDIAIDTAVNKLDAYVQAASSSLDMSIAMLQVATTIKLNTNESIGVKIGINSGYVISGLVGSKKPQYALFGDTVNTASRMKMTGEVGRIHISESTYELVKGDKTLEFINREIAVKGKGVMNTYLLEKALGTSYPNFSNSNNNLHEVDIYYNMLNKNYSASAYGDGTSSSGDTLENIPLSSRELNVPEVSLTDDELNRIKNRRTNINRAVGNEDDLYDNLYDYNTLNTSYSSNVTVGSHKRKCFKFKRHSSFMSKSTSMRLTRKFTSRLGTKHSSFSKNRFSVHSAKNTSIGSSSIVSSLSTPKEKKRKSDPSHTLKEDEIHMRKNESILLKFNDKLQEDRYRNNFYNNVNNISINEYALFIFLITFIVQSIINVNVPRIYVQDNNKLIVYLNYILYWTVRCFFILMSFILWMLFHYNFFIQNKEDNKKIKVCTFFVNLLFVSATCIFALSNSWSIKRTEHVDYNLWLNSDSVEFYFYLILLHHSTGMLFQNCLLIDSLFLVLSMTFISSSVQNNENTVTALFTIPICVLFNLLSAHCKESIDRKKYYTNEKAYMIETRINQILSEMLPKSILEEFKLERLKMCYIHENMSFLFSDIVGFTKWAESVDPSEVIALLQKLFANFDRNTTNFNLYKLCTIGDAYVAISEPKVIDNKDMRIQDLENILLMAYSMIHIIDETSKIFSIPDLKMRIGLHYGSCIGGVIGSGRLRYDVWGTDVYTANMIESNGVPGEVCVSEKFRDIITRHFPNRFKFEHHKDINIIDKTVKSYIIRNKSKEAMQKSPFSQMNFADAGNV
ncbi:Adenylate and Guanylate cyclase catalytic domain protein [Theileria parva strain Muguga]|uniref:Adenylate and Guanylate cyclase catalytic domain protein n=1 Tax=Theileria parva strain Muguga TaxID=333668 RepID=UPI001C621F56|nr:Adenylate and Guanylate cyclase catalytic domain protein [Theileria parva strain Muguga]EAN33133.2 Adenylate and Guanylate cyclase catalytic domain protein [Theileria parva strain Muguga]